MAKIRIDSPAPDFTILDYRDVEVQLSDFQGQSNVLLVFNRGFTWPYCRRHLAQLRQARADFLERDTVIVVLGPDGKKAFARYFEEHQLEYRGCPDPKHKILKLYGQQVKLFRLGRMPAQVLIDKQGVVRYAHYGLSMRDIPSTDEMLELIDEINAQ